MNGVERYDVVIVGAGPAGTACALALADAGRRVLLVDKATFPRDKVCGDAIPGLARRELERLQPEMAQQLAKLPAANLIAGARVAAPNGKIADIRFSGTGYCCRRIDFDAFLLEGVCAHTPTIVQTGIGVSGLKNTENRVEIAFSDGSTALAQVVVGADGAHSRVKKAFFEEKMDRRHHLVAVRAYYENVEEIPEDMMEIRLEKGLLPGYFWLFPLPDGGANIGLGMVASEVSKHQISLREQLEKAVTTGELGKRFQGATRVGSIKGFDLPVGSVRRPLSAARVLLAGDAGGLIDPATGEGIGNAMLSGRLAAEQIQLCFAQNRFDADFMRQYDKVVMDKLWKEFQRKYRVQKWFAGNQRLINMAIGIAGGNRWVNAFIRKMF